MLDTFRTWAGNKLLPQVKNADSTLVAQGGWDVLAAALGIELGGSTTTVTPVEAMRLSAVNACVRLIAGAHCTLPIDFYERLPEMMGRKPVMHDLWWLLNEQPTPMITAATFWSYITACKLLQGDGFALIVRKAPKSPEIKELIPLNPLDVVVYRLDNRLSYVVTIRNDDSKAGDRFGVHADDMLHFPNFPWNGWRGTSTIYQAASSAIEIARNADAHTANFFRNGAKPSFILEAAQKLNGEQITVLRNEFQTRMGGVANHHIPMILGAGTTAKELHVNAHDAQLLEARKFQVVDIARAFGVPPFMIGDVEKTSSWGSGIEQLGIGFVKYTMQPHLTSDEQELNRKFWPTRAKYFVEFNVDGLLRGDAASRKDYYQAALGGAQGPGWMTQNEVRAKEGQPPLPSGGDEVYKPAAPVPGAAPAKK